MDEQWVEVDENRKIIYDNNFVDMTPEGPKEDYLLEFKNWVDDFYKWYRGENKQ